MSSPDSMSFHTAPATPTSRSSQTLSPCTISLYRSAKRLPYELRNHVSIYIEERLYENALTLLTNLLISGDEFSPAYVPPRQHITFASTLLLHPLHTTRAADHELLQVSSRSFIYLRTLLSVTGPINSGLKEAFAFTQTSLRSTRRHIRVEREDSDDEDDDNLRNDLANKLSLYNNAQDFWHCVGWAFNCSVNHLGRWMFWKHWLEYMLDVADADWEERTKQDELTTGRDDDDEGSEEMYDARCESISMGWLSGHGRRSANLKRIVRSIFADGSTEMLRAYPEVWEHETKARKSKSEMENNRRKKKLDIDNDKYGDYVSDEDVADLAEDSSTSFPTTQESMDGGEDSEQRRRSQMGGPEAMKLRLRVIAMLSRTSFFLPDNFISADDLYNIIADTVQPLPLQTFTLFTSPTALPYIPTEALTALTQLLLFMFIPASSRTMHSTPSDSQSSSTGDCLDLNKVLSYVSFAANTASVEDNIKVSILVETLLRAYLLVDLGVDAVEQLRDGVEKGILAREKRVVDRRRKTSNQDDLELLRNSSRRLRFLVGVVEKRVVRLLAG